jgi:hypothetical protein
MCQEYTAWFNLDGRVLYLGLIDEYQITSWSSSRVTAESRAPCFTDLMTIDIKPQQVTTVRAPQPDYSSCTGFQYPDHPLTRKLVNGFDVAWKVSQEKMNKARKLVYPAARALLPVQN